MALGSRALAACNVIGKDRAAQAEIGIVGERDRFVLILHAEDERDRAEEFVAKRRVAGRDMGQDRGLHEGARAIVPRSLPVIEAADIPPARVHGITPPQLRCNLPR